jgi:hypothetical protein
VSAYQGPANIARERRELPYGARPPRRLLFSGGRGYRSGDALARNEGCSNGPEHAAPVAALELVLAVHRLRVEQLAVLATLGIASGIPSTGRTPFAADHGVRTAPTIVSVPNADCDGECDQ